MADQSNTQVQYDKIADLGLSLDELISKTSLGAKQANSSGTKRLDELYVPLPQIVNLSKIIHTAEQTPKETNDEKLQVDKVIEVVDTKLKEKREQLELQLTMLGFSNWHKDLEELQRKNPNKTVHVEDLAAEVYSKWNLLDPKELERKQNIKLGGSLYNLKSSQKEYDEMGVVSSIFSVFTGHSGAIAEQIKADKNIVSSQFNTIEKLSKAIKSADTELLEVHKRDSERDAIVAQAQTSYQAGKIQEAQALGLKADSLVESIKTRLLRADEILSVKNSFEFKEHLKELSKVQQKLTAVDKSYESTIAFMDGASRGAMMLVAVGAGVLFLPVGLGVIGTALASFGITTLTGLALATLRNGAQGLSSAANGVEFSWQGAVADIKSTTFETGLMGVGGGLMAGLKVGLGLGVAGTRLLANAGFATRAFNFVKSACGSGITAVGTSLPSNCYHYRDDVARKRSELREEIFGNNQLSDAEYAFLERNERLPFAERKAGMIKLSAETGKPIYEMSLEDKKNDYYLRLGKQKEHLQWIYGMDMTVNFICGFAGHTMAGARNYHLKGLMPKPVVPTGGTVPVVTPMTTARALVMRPATTTVQLSTHAMELAMAKFSTDLNLEAREQYLGEKASDADRARAYGQALSSQFLGNIQGDLQARQQRMAVTHTEDAQRLANETYQADIKKNGVKVKDLERLHLVEKAEGKVVGAHREIPQGTRWGDLESASRALWMWTQDAVAKACDKVTGKPRENNFKQSVDYLEQAVKQVNEQTRYTEDFKTKFAETTKTRYANSLNRQAYATVDGDIADPRVARAQFNELQKLLEGQIAEAEFHTNRALRGEGFDKNGLMTKALKEYQEVINKYTKPIKTIIDAADSVFGPAARKVAAVCKSFTEIPILGDAAKFTFHVFKRAFVDMPFLKGLIYYSAFNSASLVHGPAGIAALMSISYAASKHAAFQVGRKLGLNAPRPTDAGHAFSSRMEIGDTLRRMKSLTDSNSELKLGKVLETEVSKTVKKLDTTFAEFSQPRRGTPFLLLGIGSLYGTQVFPLLLAGYTTYLLASPFIKPVISTVLKWTTPEVARVWLADKCTNGAKHVMSDGGVAKFLRGQGPVYEYASALSPLAVAGLGVLGGGWWSLAPLGLPIYKQVVGGLAERTSHQLLNLSDTLMPERYRAKSHSHYRPSMLADMQATWSRGAVDAAGLTQMKMTKSIEDRLVHELSSKKSSVKDLARTFEVLFREIDDPIVDQVLARLGIVAKVNLHPGGSSGGSTSSGSSSTGTPRPTTPSRVLAMLRSRSVDPGDRVPLRGKVDPEKLDLITRLIEDPNNHKDILTPFKDPKKPALSSYEIIKAKAKKEFTSAIYEAIKTGNVDVEATFGLLKSRESYDTYANICKELIPVLKKSGTAVVAGKEGLLIKLEKQIIELEKKSAQARTESNTSSDATVKATKLTAADDFRDKASNLAELSKKIEDYVIRRERLWKILNGEQPVDSLNLRELALKDLTPDRIKAMLAAKFSKKTKSGAKGEDGKSETVFELDENKPVISRKEQRDTQDLLEAELNRPELSANDRLELVSWLKGELAKCKKDVLAKRLANFLEHPEQTAPRFSIWSPSTWSPFTNAKHRQLAERAKNTLKVDAAGKLKEDKVDVDARAKKFILDTNTKIEGLDPIGWRETINLPARVWQSISTVRSATSAAKKCSKLGISCSGDVDSLIAKVAANPSDSHPEMSWRMREQARIMTDPNQTLADRYNAEVKLKALLSTDLNKVKSIFQGVEKNRSAAQKRIEAIEQTAFEASSPLHYNLMRRNEILGLVRKSIVGDGSGASGTLNWSVRKPTLARALIPTWLSNIFLTATPVQVTDSSVYARRSTLWDTTVDSHDYTGYRWSDTLSSDMPRRYPSLDLGMKTADPRAYGDSWLQRNVFSWVTGPVDMRYAGYYGDSSFLRLPGVMSAIGVVEGVSHWTDRRVIAATNWMNKRLGVQSSNF